MSIIEPTLIFFRSRPTSGEACVAFTSALQSVESALILIALHRYPHALITLAAAVESAVKSSASGSGLAKGSGLRDVLKWARVQSHELNSFSEDRLDAFRNARNRMVHKGFVTEDDSESVGLLLNMPQPLALAWRRDNASALLASFIGEVQRLPDARALKRQKSVGDES